MADLMLWLLIVAMGTNPVGCVMKPGPYTVPVTGQQYTEGQAPGSGAEE
jgi:hypothetical protein